jgi:predicted nuclease with RNAse H fold
VITAGVDLAAEPKGTALAVIDWGRERATLTELHLKVGDQQIVDTAKSVDKLGIDCALGWPDEFVAFVNAHSMIDRDSVAIDGGMDWRRTLAYRETDRHVRSITGRWPLSVSTDRLGLTAMRSAGLVGRLQAVGIDVDRAGSGRIVEVYPGAALRVWSLWAPGYRTDAEVRAALVATISRSAPWLDLRDHAAAMIKSADCLDAVLAALVARSAATGLASNPPQTLVARAKREGWIALPVGRFSDLLSSHATQ